MDGSENPQAPPPGPGGLTWLHEISNTPDGGGIGDAGEEGAVEAAASTELSRIVYQTVQLTAGTDYVLSWYDMGRAMNGDPISDPNADAPAYEVAIYDQNWALAKAKDFAPTLGGTWSGRNKLSFQATTTGLYEVAFRASVDANPGSVAIADVQLEAAPADTPSQYQDTGPSLLVLSGNCVAGRPEQFRALFDHRCVGGECFYELQTPLHIDTAVLDSGYSRLEGKLAKGNYNYRHINVALNLVGTGVIDCSKDGSGSCYGSAYVDYSLEHDAYSVPILGWDNQIRLFNFGSAGIFHGKALAAERYMTIPLGSADQSLLAQPEVLKQEFRGRPLSGDYRLKIYDKPSLAWSNLEDIQLVLNYRYWSRVQREQAGSAQP